MKDIQKGKSKTCREQSTESSKEFCRESKSETGIWKGLYLHRLPQCCSWQPRRSDRWRWLILACQQHRQEDQLAGFLTGTIWLPLPLWLHPGNQWSMWLLRRSSYWKQKNRRDSWGLFFDIFPLKWAWSLNKLLGGSDEWKSVHWLGELKLKWMSSPAECLWF